MTMTCLDRMRASSLWLSTRSSTREVRGFMLVVLASVALFIFNASLLWNQDDSFLRRDDRLVLRGGQLGADSTDDVVLVVDTDYTNGQHRISPNTLVSSRSAQAHQQQSARTNPKHGDRTPTGSGTSSSTGVSGTNALATKQSLSPLLALVVGLPKSGTTTIYELFHCSGFKTSHYCCCGSTQIEYPCTGGPTTTKTMSGGGGDSLKQHRPNHIMSAQMHRNLQEGRSILDSLGDFDIHAQLDGEILSRTNDEKPGGEGRFSYFLPQHYHLEELHHAAPNVTWILNLRPAKDWAHSVMGWLDLAQRLWETDLYYRSNQAKQGFHAEQTDKQNLLSHQSYTHNNYTYQDAKNWSRNETMEFLVEFYNHHTQTIQQFVQSHPSQALVQIDITRSDAGQILAKTLRGVNVRANCWSRSNVGPFFSTISNPTNANITAATARGVKREVNGQLTL